MKVYEIRQLDIISLKEKKNSLTLSFLIHFIDKILILQLNKYVQ